jgi:hypothetical protein
VKVGYVFIRYIPVYFPDTSYGNTLVETLYSTLAQCVTEARRGGMQVLIGGDWNAQVGNADTRARSLRKVVGKYGLPTSNARGHWLRTWAQTIDLIITNTHFKHRRNQRITHTGTSGNKRQIDYILASGGLWGQTLDAKSLPHLAVGSDHNAVLMVFKYSHCKSKRRRFKRMPPRVRVGWEPSSPDTFAAGVSSRLHATPTLSSDKSAQSVNELNSKIEKALVESAKLVDEASPQIKAESTRNSTKLNGLIKERRDARQRGNTGEVTRTSKSIQKENRAILRARRDGHLQQLLESGRCLKSVIGLGTIKKRAFVTSVENSSGVAVSDRQGIADVFADFYATLYTAQPEQTEEVTGEQGQVPPIPPISDEEVWREIKQLRKKKGER